MHMIFHKPFSVRIVDFEVERYNSRVKNYDVEIGLEFALDVRVC